MRWLVFSSEDRYDKPVPVFTPAAAKQRESSQNTDLALRFRATENEQLKAMISRTLDREGKGVHVLSRNLDE